MSFTPPAPAPAGQDGSGAPGIEDAEVERRKASWPIARPARALSQEHAQDNCAVTALRSLSLREQKTAPVHGSKSKRKSDTRAEIPQRERRSMSRRSGHRFAVRTCDQETDVAV